MMRRIKQFMNITFKVEEAETGLLSDSEEEGEEMETEEKEVITSGYILSCLGKGVLNMA